MKYYLYLLVGLLLTVTACKKDKGDGGKLPLSIKSFWPNSGNAGTIVHITGTGFGATAAENEVLFNGVVAQVMEARDTVLYVLAPVKGTTGTVTVYTNDAKADAGMYTYQALSLHAVSPANGPAGTNISIRGAGFSSLTAPAKVMVNGKEALVTSVTDTLLVAAIPEAAGSGKVKVVVDGKEVEGPDFRFQVISGIKPVKGGKGTQVTISGEGFSTVLADNQVSFNSKPATIVSAEDRQLVAIAPDGVGTGAVSVSINNQRTVGGVFTVVPPPVIQTVAPLSGPAGIEVTIGGDYFSSLTDEVLVSFNGKPGVAKTTADKKITVTVPAGAGAGVVKVLVNGQESAGPVFTEQNLGVAQLLPDNGLAGTAVTIKGVGFSTNAGDNLVSFNGIAVTVVSATATELKVNAPQGVTTGPVTVKVNSLEAQGPAFKRAGVMTLAGGPSKSDFNWIQGITADKRGNVYATDGNRVFKVSASGVITTFAGQQTAGRVNGTGTEASFNFPTSLAVDANDNVYVCDRFNNMIRKITPAGVVSTYAVLGFMPIAVAVDRNGVVYAGAQYQGVYQLSANGIATRLSTNAYETAGHVAIGGNGTVYYAADTYDYNTVFQIAGGVKSIYAGSSYGFRDGTVQTALFTQPVGLAVDYASGTMYVADNNAIRSINDGNVTTLTGTPGVSARGYADGTLPTALFTDITCMCIDSEGNIYVAERTNKSIRKVFFK